jgi:hypothetical protein
LNVLNELNAPNDCNRDSFFAERGKVSRFPKTYFTAPVQKQIAQDLLPFPCLPAKTKALTPFVFKNESHVWSKRKNPGFVSHKTVPKFVLKQFAASVRHAQPETRNERPIAES